MQQGVKHWSIQQLQAPNAACKQGVHTWTITSDSITHAATHCRCSLDESVVACTLPVLQQLLER